MESGGRGRRTSSRLTATRSSIPRTGPRRTSETSAKLRSSGSSSSTADFAAGSGSSTAPTCPGCSSTPSVSLPTPGPASPSPTSGGSSLSTCGSRTSSSCSRPSWVAYLGGVELPAARDQAGVEVVHPVPPQVGGHVPRGRGVLEFPGRRRVRISHQLADCVLLRDRHRPHRQPLPRGDDGRLRDARHRVHALLPPLPPARGQMVREGGQGQFLVAQHRPGLDVLRDPPAAGDRAALPLGGTRLLGCPRAQLPHQRPQRPPGLAATSR